METLVKADIFFFVTTIVVVIVALGLVVAIYYVIKILKNMKYISEKIKNESDNIIEDITAFRGRVKEEGFRAAHVYKFFKGVFKRRSYAKRGKDDHQV